MSSKIKPEKKQHIQVFARVRPVSYQELKSQVVVDCVSSKEVSVREKCLTKTFTFDKVFGPNSKQVDVYKAVVSPLISEVLQGYNCTVFAYGQTGTGKTFTMVGERTNGHNSNWENDPNCGIIPRTLSHLFDELKVRADEFTVRVSFLELYNEELCDLLAPNDTDDGKNLKLFEDSMKKGSVIVSGLEERTVHNKDDVYLILEAGNLRRQTAPTLMNAQSSRSHTIFTITVHIKVTTPEGEDLIKTGKLNLVDLAGSENIGRSGAVDIRAREAGNINQSLLTLGRVITSLVERTPHVPYRESKLTRILQDSLGGRTKTSIIATVSPVLYNIEETLSTFDYAHRARNITNKPEINQKTSKRVLIKEYTEEIERLRRDLIATREKHGVYLASDNYHAIMAERENLNKELVSKLQLLKVREDEFLKQEEILKSLNMDLSATQNELAATSLKLEQAKKVCEEKENMLHELEKQTNEILKTADEAIADAKKLHDRLDKSRRIMERNLNKAESFKRKFCLTLSNIKNGTKDFLSEGVNEVENQIETDKIIFNSFFKNQASLKEMISMSLNETVDQFQAVIDVVTNKVISQQSFLTEQLSALKLLQDTENNAALDIISNLMEYSNNMTSDWDALMDNVKKSKKCFSELQADVKSIEDSVVQLSNIDTVLKAKLNEETKKREETLKEYSETCESLEKEQKNITKTFESIGSVLCKVAKDFEEVVQRKNKCEEELRNMRNCRILAEENTLKEITNRVVENSSQRSTHLDAIKQSYVKAECKISNLENNLDNSVLPHIEKLIELQKALCKSSRNKVEENSEKVCHKLSSLKQLCELENEMLTNHSLAVKESSSEIFETINKLRSFVKENVNLQGLMIENSLQDSLAKKLILSSSITDHSEELFSSIHNLIKEMETFFTEDMKRDEKTGNTPQRKEFNYPRHILSSYNRNKESVREQEPK